MPSAIELIAVLDLVERSQREPVALHGPCCRNQLVKPEEVHRHRSLACPEYDQCLDISYRRGWPSWTCQRCPDFALAPSFRVLEAKRLSGRPGLRLATTTPSS
jgi:hypothetical protein